jgi:serine/threonine-protein kinase
MTLGHAQKTIGTFQVREVLGHGGMSTVYKALQPDLDRTVAIKVPLPALVNDPSFRARFEREARLAARLRHPHIVTIYSVGEEAGMPYLVMEYLEGPTLHTVIRQRWQAGQGFTPAEALDLLRPLADALDYAHDRQVIHRDLKPENVILTTQGPVITDFGLAKLLQGEAATISLVMGTPAYMAPEQIEGRQVDHRTDIYALGILLYELLTGQVPFSGATPSTVAQAHLQQLAPPLADLNPRLRTWPGLEEVARRALAKEAADRWASAGAMVAALAQALTPAPVATRTTAPAASGHPAIYTAPAPARPALYAAPAKPAPAPATSGRLVFLIPLAALLIALSGFWIARGMGRRGGSASVERPTQASSAERSPAGSALTTETPDPAVTGEAQSATVPPDDGAVTAPDTTTAPAEVATLAPIIAPTATSTSATVIAENPSGTTAPAPTVAPDRTVRGIVASQGGAFLRSGPGSEYQPVGGLPNGAPVRAVGQSNGWLMVESETGQQGFILGSLVNIQNGDPASLPLANVPPPPAVQPTSPPVVVRPIVPATPVPAPPAAPSATRIPVPPPAPSATKVPAPPAPTATIPIVVLQPTAAPSPAPTAAPLPSQPGTIQLEDIDFQGGYRKAGKSIYGNRTATWVYGQGSGKSSMSANFKIAAPASGQGVLTIMGMDAETRGKALMQVKLNDVELYNGPNQFPDDTMDLATGNWNRMSFRFDARILSPTSANTVTITNLSPGPVGLPPFIALDYATIQLP